MTPNHTVNIRFHHLPSNDESLPPCQAVCCGAEAIWRINFATQPTCGHPAVPRELLLCWPHAAHWCAIHLSLPNSDPTDPL